MNKQMEVQGDFFDKDVPSKGETKDKRNMKKQTISKKDIRIRTLENSLRDLNMENVRIRGQFARFDDSTKVKGLEHQLKQSEKREEILGKLVRDIELSSQSEEDLKQENKLLRASLSATNSAISFKVARVEKLKNSLASVELELDLSQGDVYELRNKLKSISVDLVKLSNKCL